MPSLPKVRRNRRTSAAAPVFSLDEPILRLWMLRILITADAHRDFVNTHGIRNDALCRFIGLGHWVEGLDPAFQELNEFEKLEEWDRQPKFDHAAFMRELRLTHRKVEGDLAHAPLPELLQANIRRLSELVGLSPIEGRVLAFAVLIRNDRLLDDTADYLGHAMTSLKVCRAIALILDIPEADVREALSAQGLLSKAGLLTLDRDGTGTLRNKLQLLSDSFGDQMLVAESDPTALLRGTVNPASPGHLSIADFDHIQKDLDILRPLLRQALASRRPGTNVYIHGPSGTGKSQLARALARDLGCDLFEVAAEDSDGDPISGGRRLRAFRAAQTFFSKRRALIVFDEVEDVFNDSDSADGILKSKSTADRRKAWVNRTLEESPVPSIWLSNSGDLDPAFVRRYDMVFELSVPPKSKRMALIQQSCGDMLTPKQVARLSLVEALAPAVLARATQVIRFVGEDPACQQAGFAATQQAAALEHLISNTLQLQGHEGLSKVAANELPGVYDPAFINSDADLAAVAAGVKASGSARICLYGPPGTGKTAYARWLAEQLDRPLITRQASDLLSKWVGEAEKNIARAFRDAREEGAVLLIDEVDGFLQDRRQAQRSWEVTQVNEMLTQMESFEGVFLASTNLMSGMDPAALRRFDLKARFDWMRVDQALALLRRYCATHGLGEPGAKAESALRGLRQLTPGDFAAVMRQHRFRPILSAEDWVHRLGAECALKEGARSVMGFV